MESPINYHSFSGNVHINKIVGFGLIFMVVVGETTLYGLKKLKQRREIRPIVEPSGRRQMTEVWFIS